MSTPIEIVRATADSLAEHPKHGVQFAFIVDAMRSVLSDAERFQALERAHNGHGTNVGWSKWSKASGEPGWDFCPQNLAELADRLRGKTP